MSYSLDRSQLDEYLKLHPAPDWVVKLIKIKLANPDILIDPYSEGGGYHGKWLYTLGKYQLMVEIDDKQRIIHVLKYIRLA